MANHKDGKQHIYNEPFNESTRSKRGEYTSVVKSRLGLVLLDLIGWVRGYRDPCIPQFSRKLDLRLYLICLDFFCEIKILPLFYAKTVNDPFFEHLDPPLQLIVRLITVELNLY